MFLGMSKLYLHMYLCYSLPSTTTIQFDLQPSEPFPTSTDKDEN